MKVYMVSVPDQGYGVAKVLGHYATQKLAEDALHKAFEEGMSGRYDIHEVEVSFTDDINIPSEVTSYVKGDRVSVGTIVSACEYAGCDIIDFNGDKLEVNSGNCHEIYKLTVDCICAKDNRVLIYTYVNDPLEKLCSKELTDVE